MSTLAGVGGSWGLITLKGSIKGSRRASIGCYQSSMGLYLEVHGTLQVQL